MCMHRKYLHRVNPISDYVAKSLRGSSKPIKGLDPIGFCGILCMQHFCGRIL